MSWMRLSSMKPRYLLGLLSRHMGSVADNVGNLAIEFIAERLSSSNGVGE